MKLLTSKEGISGSDRADINKQLLDARNNNQYYAFIFKKLDVSFLDTKASIEGYKLFKSNYSGKILRQLEEAGYTVILQEKDMQDLNVMFSFKVKI